MKKTLLLNGTKKLFEVQCHREEISLKVWTHKHYRIHCSEHTFRIFYVVGCHQFNTIYILRFGTRTTEIWIDAHGKCVYSEKKCLESFINP